ncbi:hypothetical protein KY363_01970 [Candidatus Woesearchaeota archaeon]|nr:hypothetical protein [Candidatus Woesearchaeota archaeon]
MTLDDKLPDDICQYRRIKSREYPEGEYVVFVGREVYVHGTDLHEMLVACKKEYDTTGRNPIIVAPDERGEPKPRPIVRGRAACNPGRSSE